MRDRPFAEHGIPPISRTFVNHPDDDCPTRPRSLPGLRIRGDWAAGGDSPDSASGSNFSTMYPNSFARLRSPVPRCR